MPKVYVTNKSSHNFSEAKKFGKLIFCSEGKLNRFSTNNIVRRFKKAMKDSNKDDYILLCSLNVANALACSIFVHKHGTLNLLLYRDKSRTYIERNLVF